MKELYYHPKVPGEVREILRYYDQISPLLADDFWTKLTEALKEIQLHPQRQHFDPSGRRRRNLKRFPYHILFRELENHVRVTAVRHHNRNPEFGTRRK